MMSDHILIDGDKANFTPGFGEAPVVVQPGTLIASGPATVDGKKVCIAGDEASVAVNACAYTTPSHPIPGTGTLQIQSLATNHTARKTRSGKAPVLLVGGSFTATFVVNTPAQQPKPPAPPTPDPTPRYSGTGTFTTTNTKFTGV
jgi:hypothetical protein